MAKTLFDKIWDQHVVKAFPDGTAILYIDRQLVHEVTSAQAFEGLRLTGRKVRHPELTFATMDHNVPTDDRKNIKDPIAKEQIEALTQNCKEFRIKLYDLNSDQQGVVHIIGPELGITLPGTTIVCGDSHTATHGAFGALAFGIGTSELTYVLATGCLLLTKPKTMRVHFQGQLNKGVYAKDAIMKLIAEIGIGGATGHVIEYTGEAISSMSMAERMTICNMSIECGARAGLIVPDETTYQYLAGKPLAPKGERWQQAIAYWKTFVSDAGCSYDQETTIDINKLQPMVTWGTNPAQAIALNENIPSLEKMSVEEQMMTQKALDYIQLKASQPIANTPIDWAFIGSCTNGRIEDLRIAAKILQGNKVNPQVTMYIVPGSEAVLAQAQAEGLDQIFIA